MVGPISFRWSRGASARPIDTERAPSEDSIEGRRAPTEPEAATAADAVARLVWAALEPLGATSALLLFLLGLCSGCACCCLLLLLRLLGSRDLMLAPASRAPLLRGVGKGKVYW